MLSGALKNKIRESYVRDKNLELEAKFGSFSKGRFESSLDRQTFNRVKAYFDRMAKSVDSKTTDYIMGRVRKSVDENSNTAWMSKERQFNEDIRDYNLRISMSRETPSPPITSHFSPDIIREKSRASYLVFGNTVRIDITLVNSTFLKDRGESETTYEVEVELVDPKSLDNFEKAINVTLRLVLDTLLLYTDKEKMNVSNEINSILGSSKKGYIDNYPLVQARNLKKRDMVFGGLIGNKKTGYSCVHKTDGIRKLLYFNKLGTWLASPSSLTRVDNKEIPTFNGTILDGELVPQENRLNAAPKSKYWFLAFDALAWNSDNSIQQKNHHQRMQYAQTVADQVKGEVLMVNTKSFYNFDTAAEFFTVMRDMFRDLPLLPYKQDGLMFTPQNEIYNPHSDKMPLYKRKLTEYPDICKWKSSEDLTIDLLIKWRADITSPIGRILELYSTDRNELIPFTKFENIDYTNPLTLNLPSNTVIEYGFNYEARTLTPRRVRFDKERPNRRDVAEDVAEDILDPIDEETMKGNTFTLLRKYHNVIKRNLFVENRGRTLLDIGSGYGGDLSKWKGFERIVAVEPDVEHVEELKKRIVTYGMQEKVRIVVAGGQETEKIIREVREWLGDRADVVSSMLSLTFFWQNSDMVDALVNTIVSNVKEGGKYLFLTMDGDLVEQTFEPAFGTGQVLKKLELGPASLRYDSDKKPKELYIDIKGTIVENQKEWLVRLDDLTMRLGKYGFERTMVKKADEEKFLNEFETIMTKMYTYGIYSHKEGKLPDFEKKEEVKKEEGKVSLPVLTPLISLPPIEKTLSINLPPLTTPLVDEIEEGEDELDMLEMDKVEIVNVSWWDKDVVVRIGSIGNGDCLIHSILNAYLKIYQTNGDRKFRVEFARNLRRDIAESLKMTDPKNPGKTLYETAAQGSFPELYAEQLLGVDFQNVFGQKVDFSIQGLEKLFKSSENLGDEMYAFIAELLDIELYVMRITNKDLYVHLNTHVEGVAKKSVVVSGDNTHFETIGLIKGNLYQTFFEPDDPFILKIRSFSS